MAGPRGEILPLPVSLLKDSGFQDYFFPGLILFTVFGIGSASVAALVKSRHQLAPFTTWVLGVALLVWMLVEIAIVGYSSNPPLQPLYLGVSLALVGLGLGWQRAQVNRAG